MKLNKERIKYHALHEAQYGSSTSTYDCWSVGLERWMAENDLAFTTNEIMDKLKEFKTVQELLSEPMLLLKVAAEQEEASKPDDRKD